MFLLRPFCLTRVLISVDLEVDNHATLISTATIKALILVDLTRQLVLVRAHRIMRVSDSQGTFTTIDFLTLPDRHALTHLQGRR